MGILQRFSDIMRSNINALLDKAEDPAKMVDQMLLDLRRDFAEVKSNTAGVMADEKAAKRRLDEAVDLISRYDAAARKAVAAGEDGDARKLLEKKQAAEANLPSLQSAYELCSGNADKMRQMTQKLQQDISLLESRRDNIKATAAAAKAQERMNKVASGGPDIGASMEALDRMEKKAQSRLDKATAGAELASDLSASSDLLGKYSVGGGASVDDELARLKAEMGKGE